MANSSYQRRRKIYVHNKKKYHARKSKLNTSCWNIRTMLDLEKSNRPARRSALLAREFSKRSLDIVALSEVRLSGEGSREEEGYTFFWKGKPEGVKRESGVGFAIKSELVQRLEELPLGVTDRIMVMRLPLRKGRYASLVSVYAPTLESPDEEIGLFYSELRNVLKAIPAQDKIVLLGDFNARVGKDHDTWKVIGRHGIGKCNSNGLHLLSFCNELDLIIGNTLFQNKNKHKGTWMHPRSGHWHMIDFVITRARDRQDLHDVKVLRSMECWTDHRLVKASFDMKIKVKSRHSVTRPPKRLNVSKLNDPETKKHFEDKIINLEPLDPDNVWEDFKSKLYDTSLEVLGCVDRQHQDWFDDNDEEIKDLLEHKQNLVNRSLLPNTSEVDRSQILDELKSTKALIQKRLRVMQDSWWEAKSAEIQLAADTRDSKTFYNLLNKVYGRKSSSVSPLRSKDGSKLLSKPIEIRNRWREHYDDLLNRPSNVDFSYLEQIDQHPTKDVLDNIPTLDEVSKAVNQMNSGKAPGLDGISAELLKSGGPKLVELLLEVYASIWAEGAPQDWRDVLLISLFKKGLKDLCDNYRGIALLSIVGKVFARILLNRLDEHVTALILPESQCGFRSGRSTIDMVFSARQLQEKCIEQNLDLYQCFIDLTKAFDTVNRELLWKILLKLGCPNHFISLIRSLHDDMKAWVNFDGALSEPIPVTNGVKQGCILAPTLFGIFFAVVLLIAFKTNVNGIYIRYRSSGKLFNLRRFAANTKVLSALLRDLLYADDCDLVTHTEREMQELMDCFSKTCSAFGLTISIKKTVIMYQPAPGKTYSKPNILVYDQKLKIVDHFVYLGSTLSQDGSLDNEISLRLEKATKSFGQFEKKVWSQRGIKVHTKLGVYQACVLSALLYACETWVVYRRHIKILERFHQRCLRIIMNIKWTSFTPDTVVLEKCKVPSIECLLLKCRLRWSGHLVRMQDHRIPKQLFYGEISAGKRLPCKPKLRYKDCLKKSLKETDIPVDNWEEIATDRSAWRNTTSKSVHQFEISRIDHQKLKRDARKGIDIDVPSNRGRKSDLTCIACGRVCLSKAGLISHLRSHTTTQNVTYDIQNNKKCPECNKICKTAGGLKRHMNMHKELHHPIPNALACSICNRVFKKLSGLKSHLRAHKRTDTSN